MLTWKIYLKSGPLSFATFYTNTTPVGKHNLMNQRETHAGAAGFCRIKGEEYLLQSLLGNTRTGIGDQDLDPFIGQT